MEITVPLWTAFAAGFAAFFAPCILPVLPGFFAFLGSTPQKTIASRLRTVGASLLFSGGFATVFFLLGVGANFLGKPLAAERDLFEKIGGVLLVIFGLMLMDLIPLHSLHPNSLLKKITPVSGGIRNFVLGSVFGFAWIPCIGPILGTILYLATGEETSLRGGGLLLIFSLGLTFPFVVFSFFTPELRRVLKKIKFFARYSRLIFALLLILLGILLFFGQLATVSGWLVSKLGNGLAF